MKPDKAMRLVQQAQDLGLEDVVSYLVNLELQHQELVEIQELVGQVLKRGPK